MNWLSSAVRSFSKACSRLASAMAQALGRTRQALSLIHIFGIAGVSCVPTTAKVVQKLATEANPGALIMPQALGANISGVITSAILAAAFISLLR